MTDPSAGASLSPSRRDAVARRRAAAMCKPDDSASEAQPPSPQGPPLAPATPPRTRVLVPAMHAELDGAAPELAGPVLEQSFFARDAVDVARDLVGKILLRPCDALAARIVETEAYRNDDRACHAYGGRTVTNGPLYGPPGHAYVYRSYGIHWCFNVATGADGDAQGVLVRAAVPLRGFACMHARRALTRKRATGPPAADCAADHRELLRGPGKLCAAFAITDEHRTQSLCDPAGALHFRDSTDPQPPEVRAGPRVGVARAADVPWRFVGVSDMYWASAYIRSPRAPKVSKAQVSREVVVATTVVEVSSAAGDGAALEVGSAVAASSTVESVGRGGRAAKRRKSGAGC